jgi:hypothetical protein
MKNISSAFSRHAKVLVIAISLFCVFAIPQIALAGTPSARDRCDVNAAQLNRTNCTLIDRIVVLTNALAAIAGTIIVGSIVIGGIQYSMAGPNPQAVSEARNRIRNSIIALLMLIFTYSFVQWLVPGGVF